MMLHRCTLGHKGGSMRILLIEDNVDISSSMKKDLKQYGYTVEVANFWMQGEEKAFLQTYDCIILDLDLPNHDGLRVLSFLHNERIKTPVLLLTILTEQEQNVLGLHLRPDEYMMKPIDMVALHHRIQALIHSYQHRIIPLLKIDDISINPKTKVVSIKRQVFDTSPQEYAILEYLAIRHPESVSAEELAKYVYHEHTNSKSAMLRVDIAKLRNKIQKVSGEDLLKSLRGRGYYLNGKL